MGDWTREQTLDAVRKQLSGPFNHRDRVDSVRLEGDDVEIRLRDVPGCDGMAAVRFPLDNQPVGPHTGEPCPSVECWALEIGWELEEAIGTREIATAEQRPLPGGLTLLEGW